MAEKKKKNRNIRLIKSSDELCHEINYSEYQYREHFKHICNLVPDKENERLTIDYKMDDKKDIEGLVYIFVINDKILKIGQTIGKIKDRVQSYNCGKSEHRISGTASTTNYFVLQSLLNIKKKVKVYAYFVNRRGYEIFGEKGKDCFPSTKVVERKFLKDFISLYKKKPIANTQR